MLRPPPRTAVAGTRATRMFGRSGAVPSTTNVVKLRCNTESFASTRRVASTTVAGSLGIVTVSGGNAPDIHGRYGTRATAVSHVRRSPSAFQPYSSVRRVSESPNLVLPLKNDA